MLRADLSTSTITQVQVNQGCKLLIYTVQVQFTAACTWLSVLSEQVDLAPTMATTRMIILEFCCQPEVIFEYFQSTEDRARQE